jgi:hypothetical protein
MPTTLRSRYWLTYLPGLAITLLALLVAAVLGGPIAAAMLAMAAIPASLLSSLLCLGVQVKYKPSTGMHSLALGVCLSLLAAGIVLLWLSAMGPRQIM